MRLLFGYRGALFWAMKMGMGDAFFAPLYELLVTKGVCFHFFHRVDSLEPSDDGHFIERVRIGVQHKTKHGPYRPLMGTNEGGIPHWPSEPDYEQLEIRRDVEDESRYDLETPGHDGPEADWLVLERGVHFDELVLSGRDLGSNDEVQTLHECVRLVQREIHPAGGSINKVVTDEKGTSILVAFGSRSARTLYDVGHAVVACVRALEAGGSCFISTWIGCRFPDCFDTIRAIRISCGA